MLVAFIKSTLVQARASRKPAPASCLAEIDTLSAPWPRSDATIWPMATERVLCVGDVNLDVSITVEDQVVVGSDSQGTVEILPGGSAANVASWLTAGGVPTRFVGAIGRDLAGQTLHHDLEQREIDVHLVAHPTGATKAIAALVGSDGERSLVSDLNHTVALSIDDYQPQWLDGIRWLHLTGYSYIHTQTRPLFVRLINEAHRRHIPTSVDPSAAELLRQHCDRHEVLAACAGTTLLCPNQDEATYLTGLDSPADAAVKLLDLASMVAVTCGSAGVVVAQRPGHNPVGDPGNDDAMPLRLHAEPVTMVDAIGCGDAFAAGVIAGLVAGLGIEKAAQQGNEWGSRAATTKGGRPALGR